MTPAEAVVAEAIRQEREDNFPKRAIKPLVIARTGVSEKTYWRVLGTVNREDGISR